ncbi:MAG: DNA polymerase III subunit delta' [Pseudomonadota bacterium]
MTDDPPPEPDCLEGALHPRVTPKLYGQDTAEQTFLTAFDAGRVHHAWLIAGPQGVGKATLAWRIARFLLATPTDQADGLFGAPDPVTSLDVAPDHPVARRMVALSEPRLFLLRRPWDDKAKRLKQEITIDEARKLKGFFALSAAEGGRRVVIVDSADELNGAAANAILKLLEEPPAQTVLLLISNQPSRLLPTIRSRCRILQCTSLSPDDLTAALAQQDVDARSDTSTVSALAGGSVGAAMALISQDGVALYQRLAALMATMPKLNRPDAIAMADWAGSRSADGRFSLALDLIDLFLCRLARAGVSGPPMPPAVAGEDATLQRLSPDLRAARGWAALQQTLGAEGRHAMAVNLDPSAVILDMVLRINGAAQDLAAPERHRPHDPSPATGRQPLSS